ncbi:MAG: hypothetical protein JW934_11635 [Anaerolineae bacterium]|nr:hypothetical protein [Anaerolineae bacterium]
MNSSKTAAAVAVAIIGLVFLCVGGVLGAFGVLYVLAAHDEMAADPGGRLAIGIVMIVIGLLIWAAAAVGAFLAWRRLQPKPEQKITIKQEVELTGDINLATLKCQQCNATLNKSAITVQSGAVMVACPFCGATYQIVEEPKW